MEEESDFETKFHNIKGDEIADRKANFFKLLRTPSLFSSEIQLDNTLKCLTPTTYQEQLFYIETLMYFKRTEELLDILQQGNEIFISKILKQQWFVESAFKDVEVDWFVNDLLPCLSFSVKKKLISKIARCLNEEKLDVLFDQIYLKYGLSLALPILIKCSVVKIQSVIEESDLKLRTVQVLQLYDKCENIFILYLNHINSLTSSTYNDKKVLNHIAKKNPKLLLKLKECQKISISKIGKRISKIVINTFAEGIPFDIEHYLPILNKSVLIRKVGRDFDPVIKKKFPHELRYIKPVIDDWFKYYPKKRRWECFTQTCFEKYSDVDLNKLLLFVDYYNLITLNYPRNILHTWAEVNYRGKYISFLKYYELYRAIGIIKEKIQNEEAKSERESLVVFLISLCRNEYDLTALEAVLEYICTKHKNQHIGISVLKELQSWRLENFNENIWRYTNELICYLKNQNAFEFKTFKSVLKQQLEYLVRRKKEYKAELLYYTQNIEIERFSVVEFYANDHEVEKTIYVDICKTICEPNYTCSVNISHVLRAYLLAVLNFSLKNPKYRINIMEFEKFLSIIDVSFKKTQYFNYEDLILIPKVILYNIKFEDCAVPHQTF